MQITVSNENNVFGPLELSEELQLMDLVALLELECQFDNEKHSLRWLDQTLDIKKDKTKTLKELAMEEDGLLLIETRGANSTSTLAELDHIESFRQQLLQNSSARQQMQHQIPNLEQIVNDPLAFKDAMNPLMNRLQAQQNPWGISQQEYKKLMDDPDAPENQQRIAELIQQQAIDEQLRHAYEYTPEMFTQVYMLYINLEINGHPVKALVDSGAQMTIMHSRLVAATGLSHLLDKRYTGEGRGAGVAKILGRIHQVQVKIETQFLPCSITVMDANIDMILGLDMLKRHRACIDLGRDVLKIADVETKFLGESDIPKDEKESAVSGNEFTNNKSRITTKIAQPTQASNSRSRANDTPNIESVSFPESTIKNLVDLGFSRIEVIKALTQTNGNAEYAAALLFQ